MSFINILIGKVKQRCTYASLLATREVNAVSLVSMDEILELENRARMHALGLSNQFEVSLKKTGESHSIYKGGGLDYDESRLYQEGDDTRNINWKLSARSNDIYLKIYREEKQPAIYLLIDKRSSMYFGTRKRLKVAQAVRLAGYLSFKALQAHTDVIGLVLQEKSILSPSLASKQAVLGYIKQLAGSIPPGSEDIQEVSLTHSLSLLQQVVKSGSSIYLISDFIDLSMANRNQLYQLASENNVYALHVTDPAEWALPEAGVLNFVTSNNHERLTINTDNRAVTEGYGAAAKQYFLKQKEIFDMLNIPYLQIQTVNDDIEALI